MKDKNYEQMASKIMVNALDGVKAQIRKSYEKGYKDGYGKGYNEAIADTVKVAKWVIHPNHIYSHYVCNRCLTRAPYDCCVNYCPNCGSRMVEPQESEEKE